MNDTIAKLIIDNIKYTFISGNASSTEHKLPDNAEAKYWILQYKPAFSNSLYMTILASTVILPPSVNRFELEINSQSSNEVYIVTTPRSYKLMNTTPIFPFIITGVVNI